MHLFRKDNLAITILLYAPSALCAPTPPLPIPNRSQATDEICDPFDIKNCPDFDDFMMGSPGILDTNMDTNIATEMAISLEPDSTLLQMAAALTERTEIPSHSNTLEVGYHISLLLLIGFLSIRSQPAPSLLHHKNRRQLALVPQYMSLQAH
jgi:hypothetical protein